MLGWLVGRDLPSGLPFQIRGAAVFVHKPRSVVSAPYVERWATHWILVKGSHAEDYVRVIEPLRNEVRPALWTKVA
jgi:hypothetical protein